MVINKIKNNQSGFNLIELLVVLVIIILISTVVIIQLRVGDEDAVKIATEQLASDLRQVRNLASSRVIDEDGDYPENGYGIFFYDSYDPSVYILFADSDGILGYGKDDYIISTITLSDNLQIRPTTGGEPDEFFIIFKTEHDIFTDIVSSGFSYPIRISLVDDSSKWGQVSIMDMDADNYTWGNIEVNY